VTAGVAAIAGGAEAVGAGALTLAAFSTDSCDAACLANLLRGYWTLSVCSNLTPAACSRASWNSAKASAASFPPLHSASSDWVLPGYRLASNSNSSTTVRTAFNSVSAGLGPDSALRTAASFATASAYSASRLGVVGVAATGAS
jgi:hypothetical protein